MANVGPDISHIYVEDDIRRMLLVFSTINSFFLTTGGLYSRE